MIGFFFVNILKSMKRIFVNNYQKLLVMLFFFWDITGAQACYYLSTYTPKAPTQITIDLGDVTTQVDAASGILKSIEGPMTSFGGAPAKFSCGSSQQVGPISTYIFITGSTGYEEAATYPTNISGIGVKIYYYSTQATSWGNEPLIPTQIATKVPVTLPTPYYDGYQNNNAALKVELVRTGPVQPVSGGSLIFQQDSFMWADSGAPVNLVNLEVRANVTVNTCNIDTSSPTQLSLGSIGTDSFSLKGSTAAEKNFEIILDCTGTTNVNMTISGYESNEIIGQGVLASDKGSNMSEGVGVQILNNGEPVKFNENFVVGNSSNGKFQFPLTARFYKTTDSPIKPGSVRSHMLYTLTYQ